ncbi:unnamed protein product, partial [Protopolystoma xenopodis]
MCWLHQACRKPSRRPSGNAANQRSTDMATQPLPFGVDTKKIKLPLLEIGDIFFACSQCHSSSGSSASSCCCGRVQMAAVSRPIIALPEQHLSSRVCNPIDPVGANQPPMP